MPKAKDLTKKAIGKKYKLVKAVTLGQEEDIGTILDVRKYKEVPWANGLAHWDQPNHNVCFKEETGAYTSWLHGESELKLI